MAKHYQSKHAEPSGSGSGGSSKGILIAVAIILGVLIACGGVYALLNFVIFPAMNDQAAEPEIPTFSEEPTFAPKPTAAPTEPPTEAPTLPEEEALAENYLAGMTDQEKIYQLFVVTPEAITGVDVATVAGDTTKEKLAEYPVGGIVYFAQNIDNTEQTVKLLKGSQGFAKTPMFLAVDEEGGPVARVAEKLDTTELDAMYTYKDDGTDKAHDNAKTIASDIAGLGFNLDFAPVADVWTNPDNDVIGDRAYSDDYQQAADLVASAVKGFADGGVLSTLKHFPGHGSTTEDSHDGLATVSRTVDELKSGELLPFKSGIEAGADMVMVGHLVVTDLDPDRPATLSSKVVPELLRQELGYDGIVITDGMNMSAITDNYDTDTIIKGIFDADIDMILMPDDLDAYVKAIEKALSDGSITMEQIDTRVKKILTLKFKKGLMAGSGAVITAGATEAASETATQADETTAAVNATTADAPDTQTDAQADDGETTSFLNQDEPAIDISGSFPDPTTAE